MLSLILPTYNEAENLPPLLRELSDVLRGTSYEVIVVDDNSPDRTWEVAEKLKEDYPFLRVIRRTADRGLSPAVVEGMRAAAGEVFAVMDADGQHDPRLLITMYEMVHRGADVVIGSRYVEGGSVGNWHIGRRLLSASGTLLTRLALHHRVRDPLSGLFMIRRDTALPLLQGLHPQGFKILLDLLIRLPSSARVTELPFVFRTRVAGRSKLTFAVHLAVLYTLFPVLLHRFGRRMLIILCVMWSLLLLLRVLSVGRIYTSPRLRAQTQHALQQLADENGWLISDLSLRYVGWQGVTVVHRFHGRGPDPTSCWRVSFPAYDITPCDD